MAYGIGFGLGGAMLAISAPKVSARYIALVFAAIATLYWSWRFALASPLLAFVAAAYGVFSINSGSTLLSLRSIERAAAPVAL